MENSVEKISASVLENIMSDYHVRTSEVDWCDTTITVKRVLNLRDMVSFVHEVFGSCFSTDDSAYLPYAKDFAIRVALLRYYANFELPADIELQYDIVYGTDVVNVVLDNIDMHQFESIVKAAEEMIKYTTRTNIEGINRQVRDIVSSLDGVQKQFSNVFSGITSNDVQNIVKAVAGGQLDEEKLVQAYINQSNS